MTANKATPPSGGTVDAVFVIETPLDGPGQTFTAADSSTRQNQIVSVTVAQRGIGKRTNTTLSSYQQPLIQVALKAPPLIRSYRVCFRYYVVRNVQLNDFQDTGRFIKRRSGVM